MSPLPPLALNAWLRYDAVERALADADGVATVLEIGAGQGGFGARLARRYRYLGLEADRQAAEVARGRVPAPGEVVLGDLSALPPGSSFDLVCAFEVLEHIADDVGTLRGWRELVRPGGWLLLSTPAGSHRFGPWDEVVGHYRRYDRASLAATVREAGFADPRVLAYGFPLGYGLEAARNLIARRKRPPASMRERTAASGRTLQPGGRLGSLTRPATAPFRLAQRPFAGGRWGTGLVVSARRER